MKYIELFNYAKTNNKNIDYEEEAIYFLVEEICNKTRSEIIMNMNELIDEKKEIELIQKINKYIYDNIPVQYILNKAYFYDFSVYVNENVLIPRYDTEIVVESAINIIKEKYNNKNIKAVDIGTGSGIIAISLAKHVKNIIVDAIDISKEALDVARNNAYTNHVDINFICNDLLEDINTKYDVIISNPPYIDKLENIMELVKNNEPHLALYSNDNGLYHYKKIINQSLNNLKEDGIIIFEIPDNKCDILIEYINKYYNSIEVIKDYNNQRRCLIIQNK